MMAIVKRKDSPYKDGRFPSGLNWEDYILWCLIEMGKECDREEAAKIDSAQKEAVAEKATENDAGTDEEQGEGGPPLDGIGASNSLSADEEDRYPNKTFFKCGAFLRGRCGGSYPSLIVQACKAFFSAMPRRKLRSEERQSRGRRFGKS